MTQEKLDPYRKWLGIPPEDQPPNHYRLLGIENLEDDPDVIAIAADGRMAQVKNFQAGEHSVLSQKILNEISAARVCLLNADRKAEYDESLKQKLAEKEAEANKSAPDAMPAVRRDATAPGVQPEVAEAFAGIEAANMFANVSQRSRKRSGWHIPVAVGLGLVAAVGIAVAIMVFGQPAEESVARKPIKTPVQSEEDAKPEVPTTPDAGTDEDQSAKTQAETALVEETPPGDTPKKTVEERPEVSPEEPSGQPAQQLAATEKVGRRLASLLDPLESGSFVAVSFAGFSADSADAKTDTPDRGNKRAVPAKPERAKAEEQVRKIFDKEFAGSDTADGKLFLAATLAAQAEKSLDDPVARFVLMQLACSAAADAGQLKEVVDIIDRMDDSYAIDASAVKAYYLGKVLAVRQVGPKGKMNARLASEVALQLTEAAAKDDDYSATGKYMSLAISAARKTQDVILVREIAKRGKEIDLMRRRYAAVSKALEQLAEDPDDAEANLRVGKWYCFTKDNWPKGLPYLAKSKDLVLASLAEKDAADPIKPAEQKSLADGWWEASSKEKSSAAAILARAAEWYAKALPGLSSLEKVAVNKRLAQIAAATEGETPKARGAVKAGNVALASNGTTLVINGRDPMGNNYLLDGKTDDDKLSAYARFPCEMVVTFDKPYRLSEIRLLLRGGDKYPWTYGVEVSPDGKTFSPLLNQAQGTRWQRIPISPQPVKAVKLKGISVKDGYMPSFHVIELEAYCVAPATPR